MALEPLPRLANRLAKGLALPVPDVVSLELVPLSAVGALSLEPLPRLANRLAKGLAFPEPDAVSLELVALPAADALSLEPLPLPAADEGPLAPLPPLLPCKAL